MDLEKVKEIVLFGDRVTETEKALTPKYIFSLRGSESLIFLYLSSGFGLLFGFLGLSGGEAFAAGFILFIVQLILGTMFHQKKLYLPKSVREFYKLNKTRINSIDSAVEQFNSALFSQQSAQKLLTAHTEENDETLTTYWQNRREPVEKQVAQLVAELQTAVNPDLKRMEAQRQQYRKSAKFLRREFAKKVWQLQRLEKNLNGLNDGYNGTQDISPYVAAAKLRQELEKERVELGLPEKTLPKPKVKHLLTQ